MLSNNMFSSICSYAAHMHSYNVKQYKTSCGSAAGSAAKQFMKGYRKWVHDIHSCTVGGTN